jgi:hypothetical protein
MIDPKVLNEYLKGGLGRFAVPMPDFAKSDPFWLKEDPHRTAHTQQTLFGPCDHVPRPPSFRRACSAGAVRSIR